MEFQPVFTRFDKTYDSFWGIVAAYVVTSDLTWRTMFEYEKNGADKRAITQLYYYLKI